MSFKGIVTRKDEDTGVNLLAKIVTPNKKRSTKKIFSVKVKANSLSDFECCVIDVSTARSKITKGINIVDVRSDVPMSYYGENGTTISYKIIDVDNDSPKLSKYLKSDGKLNGRPKYGEGDATGFIEIEAKKNAAKTSTRISVTILQTSATEVLFNDTYFTHAIIWNIIRKTNAAYSSDESSSGHKNIKADLDFKESYVCPLTDTPIQLEYNVQGGEINVNGSKVVRMSNSGVYGKISYINACTLVGSSYNAKISGSPNVRTVIIGDLTITVTLKLGSDATRSFVFNCATSSEQITNEEVLNALTDGILQYYTSTNGSNKLPHTFSSSISTSSPDYIFTGINDGEGEITVYKCGNGGNGANLLSIPSLKLSEGEVILETSYEIKNIQGTGSYDDNMINQAFNGGQWSSNAENTQSTLKFKYNNFYSAASDKKSFSVACKIDIKAYGGDQLKGSRTVYARFAVNTEGMTDPSAHV